MRIILILIIIFLFLLKELPTPFFHLYFLDVGQGDAIFLKTPQNHHILIDGGKDNTVLSELAEIMPFLNKTIDLIILTHPDSDHLNGLIGVLERYDVKNIYLTFIGNDKPEYHTLFRLAQDKGINLIIADAKTDFLFGNLIIDVIYPFQNISGNLTIASNDTSIVTKIIYQEHKILLTGDLELPGENELLNTDIDLTADIYKAGHHGSKTSSSLPFLKRIKPKISVVQAGKDNSYGHPHYSVIQNLYLSGVQKIYSTAEDGRVEFVFN